MAFLQEQRPDKKRDRCNDDGIVESSVDIPGTRNNRESDYRKQTPKDAIADVVRQRQRGISNFSWKRFHQKRGDRAVYHGHEQNLNEYQECELLSRGIRDKGGKV